MKLKLTTRSVSASTPRSKYYKAWDTDLAGFFLRVLPSGVKTYCIYYRHKGVGREYTIGKDGKITADQARKQAKIKLGEIAKGKDIQTEKKIASVQSKVKKYQTLGGFIEAKYKPWILTERKTGKEIIRDLSREFEHLFLRAITDITPW
ncbi:MAG: Arm DNA-binding domain-containing protein, partial [Gammaproteobacteria bacterium]|nr:Arm DNA-binding domain-containing protein [Gammaproteobacteria bacterium]